MGIRECQNLNKKLRKISGKRKLSNFFSREVGSPRARTRGKFKVAKKEGPTDVGMTGGWKAASYSIGIDSADFLAERLSSFRKRISGAEVVHKAGPREIGFVTDWTPANYDIKEDEGNFLAERITPRRNASNDVKAKKKLGPRDIGTVNDSNWKPAEYAIAKDDGDFLRERTSSRNRSETPKKAKKKAGPRDIGFVSSDWTPAEFDKSKSVGSSSSDSGKKKRSKSVRGPPSSRRNVQKNGPANRSNSTRSQKSTNASKKFLTSRRQDGVSSSRNLRKSSEPVPKRSKSPAQPTERKGSLASAERSRPNISTDEQMHPENAGKSSDPPQQRTKLKAKWGLIKRDQSFGGGSSDQFAKDTQNFDSDDVYE